MSDGSDEGIELSICGTVEEEAGPGWLSHMAAHFMH